ncbi:MAG: DUF5801 domain-containing protein [Pseudomonadota bacterium]|nr:DUF5801 domain-containing protein [Pseudomonadota bacterium]
MRYEDASGAFQASGPIANDDADTLSAGQRGPATGNLITGEGTQHGSAGADSAAGAQVAAIAGKGGEDTSFSGGKLSVAGEHGQLTVDADGNYSYLANGNVENVRDRFTYTLADNQGNSDTASLIVEIGKTPAVIKADAQQIVPGPDGVVTLPPGVELSDVRVVGRNLVVDLPDGTQLIILDGAIFVPQLVLGGVEVPATNVAALLIGQEVQPAAGEIPPSGGGSFALPPPPLDPGIPLGDLIPPTEYNYVPPEPQEVLDIIDRDPEIFVQPDGQPASVAAVDSVDERGLPTRNGGEPEGSGEEAAAGANGDASEATTGTIIYDSPDGVDSIALNGVVITSVGQVIAGAFGNLTITSIAPGAIGYSYTLLDNTSGNDTQDDFEVVLTDDDGDTATATLTIDIIDDVPTARPDTDSIAAGQFGPVTGNVITDASAGDAGDSDSGRDTVGADNASITAVSSANVPANSDNGAPFVVNGQYGVLTLQSDGSYSYVRNPGTPGGVNDVFNYTLTDGDGDTSTTTLTISIADTPPTIDVPVAGEDGTQVSEVGLPTRNGGEPAGSGESADGNGADNDDTSETTSGVVNFTPGDGPATIRIDGVAVTSVGQTFNGDHGVLTITAISANSVSYSYTLTDNTSGNATSDSFGFSVTDQDGDVANGNLVIGIVDDVPTAVNDTDLVPAGTFGPATGNVVTDAAAGDAGDGDNGADTVGADNATVSGLASNNVPANVDNDAAGGFTVNGQYGVLTMQADGSYSYVRNPGTPGGVNDVFTYTLTDGDGDSDTATLTISIADSPVTLDAPDQGEAGTVVSEVGLPTRNGGEPAGSGESADGNGADNDDTSETTAGAITFTAPDGPATITIDGVAVTAVGQTFAGSFGTLTITSIAGGSIGYSYTLADNTSGNATSDDFAISVTDADGDVANDTLVINIIDDVPTAVNDTDTVPSGQTTATGNVITDASAGDAGDGDTGADTVGADNATVSGVSSNNVPANSDNNPAGGFVVAGQHGTLTMQADGSYSYVRADGAPGTFQDVFTYTLTDGDGDSDTATLTIDISDAPTSLDVPTQGEAGTLVSELGLPTRNGGEPAGTGEAADGNGADNDDASETTAGVISFTAPDGPATVTIDGVAVTGTVGQTFNGAHGVLTITSYNAGTGQIGYSYTLTDNTSGNATFDDFAVVVTDNDGDSSNATLTINIVDDAPIAVNDTDSIPNGGTTATGNVITDASAGDAGDSDTGADTVGADNAAVSGVSSNNVPANSDNDAAGGFVVVGQYGTLTMQADGNYSYVRADGSPGNVQDVFTYTLTDGDGDTTTATLTISIADAAPNLPDPAAVLLDDDALAGGNAGGTGDDVNSAGTPGQLLGTGGDGDLDYAFTGVNTLPAGFTVNPVNAGQIQILQGATVVLTVTLNTEDGSYTVVQNNPIDHPAGSNENNLPFSIGVQVVDADGDAEGATISINVDDDTPVAANDTDTIASGGNTATGNVITDASAGDAGDSDTGADSVGADGGAAIVGLASNNVPANVDNNPAGGFVVVGQFGTLTMQADGSYSYLRADGSPGNAQDVFTYTLVDGDGDTTTATLTIGIEDAAPNLPDPAAVLLDDDALAGGNAGGTGDDVNSAGTPGQLLGTGGDGDLDYAFTGVNTLPAGFTVNPVNAGQIQILQGATVVLTVTLNTEDGSYTVVQNNPIDHPAGSNENNLPFSIGVQVVDADGDAEGATITINVDDDTPVAANDTDSIPGGSNGPATGNVITDAAAGDAGDSDAGADSVGADGGAAIVGLASNNVPANVDNDAAGGFVVAGQFGTLTMQADGSYSYLRNDGQGAGQNEVFTYTLTDGDGDTTTATLTISIADATPTLPDPAAVLLDDDALAGGNAGGTGDDVNSAGTPGQLLGTGGDGDLDYAFTGVNTLPAGFTVNPVNAGQIRILQGATVVLTVTLNTEDGSYTVVQNNPISHPAGSNENNLPFSIGVQVVDADGDTEGATISINVDDDTPTVAISTAGLSISVDESAGNQADSNDVTGPLAVFNGVANKGDDPDVSGTVIQFATSTGAVSSTGSSVGADAPGSVVKSLDVSSAGVDSGLNTTDGTDILLYNEGGIIVGRVGSQAGAAAFAIAIDPVTGVISMVEYLSIQHPNAANADDSVAIANGAILAVVTVSDADGDSASTSTPIGSLISFQDSGPVMTAASDINIQNSGDVAHTGAFAFNLGADGAPTSNDVIKLVTGSATVNGNPVTNYSLVAGAENATTASYTFSFDYPTGSGNATATGTLVFDKVAGTYTVDLANPIQGVTTILQTAQGTLFQGYEFGTSTPDGSQPAISVTQIQDLAGTANDIYVQFTGVSEPSSGTGDDNLEVANWVPGADNPPPVNGGGDTAWNAGQLFNQTDSWVSTSNSANGVAGDTIQGGEVLDFSLVQGANPTGNLAQPATFAQASAMFLKFDGIGSGEDMIVVLKLYDPNTNTYTTRAIMIENGDIQKGPGAGPGQFSGVTLDNNDGLVIIESNDYNQPGENWVIVGAQIAGSDEGVTGTAINLNSAIGAAGDSDVDNNGSLDTDALGFQSDTNDGPFKISSIGFLTTSTTPQNAELTFNVTVQDGDGDTVTQTVVADITASADSSTPIALSPAVTTISQAPLSSKSTAAVAETYQPSQQTAANNNVGNTGIVSSMVAASGLAMMSGSLQGSNDPSSGHVVQNDFQSLSIQAAGREGMDSSLASISLGSELGGSAVDAVNLSSSGFSFDDHGFGGGSLDARSFGDAEPAYAPSYASGEAAVSIPALAANVPTVSMASAEMLKAVGLEGNVQHGGSVEQVLADALGSGAPTIDGVLANLPGAVAELAAIANLASPDGAGVPAWDMGMDAGFAPAQDMLMKVAAVAFHQDAVQPA